jgi:septum formation protein
MWKNLIGKRIILASGSPRRKELLGAMGLDFEVFATNVDESYEERLKAWEIPMSLSERKALSLSDKIQSNDIVIAADTIVWTDKGALNKPEDSAGAQIMLETLSGKSHTVYTGVTILTQSSCKSFYDATEVKFSTLLPEEIQYYIQQFNPYDKAGAYGAQDWIGVTKIESIHGSYFNVMGLPTHKLYIELSVL